MKMAGFVLILMIAGSILVTGCVLKPTENGIPSTTSAPVPGSTIKNPVFGEHLQTLPFGQLNISIGNYDARLSVYVDDIAAGEVSPGKPLNLKIVEGDHVIRVCAGVICETVKVDILSGTVTTIDFEERIRQDIPMGTLNVTIGNYFTVLPVYIDNSSAGNVSPNEPFTRTISPGHHSIKICNVDNCYTENVEIIPRNETAVDFTSRLISGINQADLTISIGGYEAQQLPVFIDNISAGFISQGTPISVKTDTGIHEVKICSGSVCITEQVEVKFAKPNFIDFEAQLKQKAEFTKPVVRIVDFTVNGDNLRIYTEFINPSDKELTMTATFSCVYSYINQYHERVSTSARSQLTTIVPAGGRSNQLVEMWLQGGSYTVASNPVITNVTIK